ncbi:hypothetical protein KCU83_g503, partial [Aureobasidium melanogenum]
MVAWEKWNRPLIVDQPWRIVELAVDLVLIWASQRGRDCMRLCISLCSGSCNCYFLVGMNATDMTFGIVPRSDIFFSSQEPAVMKGISSKINKLVLALYYEQTPVAEEIVLAVAFANPVNHRPGQEAQHFDLLAAACTYRSRIAHIPPFAKLLTTSGSVVKGCLVVMCFCRSTGYLLMSLLSPRSKTIRVRCPVARSRCWIRNASDGTVLRAVSATGETN